MEKEVKEIKEEIKKFLLDVKKFKSGKKDIGAPKLIEQAADIKFKLLFMYLDESISRDDFGHLSSLLSMAERYFRNAQELRYLKSPLR